MRFNFCIHHHIHHFLAYIADIEGDESISNEKLILLGYIGVFLAKVEVASSNLVSRSSFISVNSPSSSLTKIPFGFFFTFAW